MRGVWNHAQDGPQMAWALCCVGNGGVEGTKSCAAQRGEADTGGGGALDSGREASACDVGTKEDPADTGGQTWSGKATRGEHGGGGTQEAWDGGGAQAAGSGIQSGAH